MVMVKLSKMYNFIGVSNADRLRSQDFFVKHEPIFLFVASVRADAMMTGAKQIKDSNRIFVEII